MIRTIPDLADGVVGIEIDGKLSGDDYRATIDPIIADALENERKLRVVVVLGEDAGFTVGSLIEDTKAGTRSWSAWERIAIVSDSHTVREAIHLLGWAFPGEIRTFAAGAVDEAAAWASGS